jgi:hypothetical protein
MQNSVYVAIAVSSGAVYHAEMVMEARMAGKPRLPGWIPDPAQGTWHRAPTDANIEAEVRDLERYWSSRCNTDGTPHADAVTVVSWRRIDAAERVLFQHDRTYRNALVMQGDKIAHDMPKARECHRNHLRRLRAHALPELDAQWMRATGQGKTKEAVEVEAKRQKWRDATANPAIDAAATVDELKALQG